MIVTRRETVQYPLMLILRLAAVLAADVGLLWLAARLAGDGSVPLAILLSLIAVAITVCFTVEQLRAWRWLCIGFCMAALFVVYPIYYTLNLSTTNMGHGHVLTKQGAIATLEREQYVPEGGITYRWTAFRADDGSYALWLQADDAAPLLVREGEVIADTVPGANGIGTLDDNGVPVTIDGYTRLERRDVVALIDPLSRIAFGSADDVIRVTSLSAAAATQPRYRYDAGQDAIIDQETGGVYFAQGGTFESAEGEALTPGYFESVGTANFERFFASSALRGPLTTIITWNFGYAIFSVVLSFALGLFIALLFNDLPGKRLIRTLLIIPYPIPALVSILIWRNLLNPDFGALVSVTESIFGTSPDWLTNPSATRLAILLINMWLSYPYFYIVSSGALQAIPTDFQDAAAVDGANVWQRFMKITLPLLLRIVSPLLVASFAFNFNNFNLIYIFNSGNPPIAGSPIPAGHTDILISFVYKLAFNSAQSDYGLASAISIVLFVFVAAITWVQFRYTRIMEDRS